MRRLLPVLAVVLLPLLGCSSSDSGGDSLEDRRAEYVESAEQICADTNEEVEALTAPTGVDTVADYTDEVVALLEASVDEVTALEPPEQDAAELTEKVLDPFADDVGRAQEYADEVRTAAEAGDSAALLTLVREVPQTSADLEFMREYGLVQCASAADTTS